VFDKYIKGRPSPLDEPIRKLVQQLDTKDPTSEDFDKMTEQLDRLVRMRAAEPKSRVSPDTILIVVGGIAQVLIIIGYEHVHVVASKALNYVFKMHKSA
jgi:hypothetical protein